VLQTIFVYVYLSIKMERVRFLPANTNVIIYFTLKNTFKPMPPYQEKAIEELAKELEG
jgi:hypothetical protein